MLDLVHPWGGPIAPSLSKVLVQRAAEPWHFRGYHRLRREVFVVEQGLFEQTDLDAHDARATPIVALSQLGGMPDDVVGVVRVYPGEDGVWYGGRLAVARPYRRAGNVGAALIEAAVLEACSHGCRRFLATVQAPNVRYFERHAFRSLDVEPFFVGGRPHLLMEAELTRFAAPVGARADGRAAA